VQGGMNTFAGGLTGTALYAFLDYEVESMKLISKADLVVRELLPALFEAAGRRGDAEALRHLPELSCHKSILLACGTLEDIRVGGRDVQGAAHWCEKAVWSAVAGDALSFRANVDRAHAAMREGLASPGAPLN